MGSIDLDLVCIELAQIEAKISELNSRKTALWMACMEAAGDEALTVTPLGYRVKKIVPRILETDPEKIPQAYMTTAVDVAMVRKAMEAGQEVPGARWGSGKPYIKVTK